MAFADFANTENADFIVEIILFNWPQIVSESSPSLKAVDLDAHYKSNNLGHVFVKQFIKTVTVLSNSSYT